MDRAQNQEVERMAKDAAAGKGYDWRKVPIYSVDGGVANVMRDFSTMSGPVAGRWWEHREPTFLRTQGEGIAERLMPLVNRALRKFARDGVEEENRWPKEEVERKREEDDSRSGEAKDAAEYEKYLPELDQDAHAWLAEFAKQVDMNVAGRRELFSALSTYIDKFGAAVRARELNAETIRKLVEQICQDY
jgi:hypothetical protein